MRSAFCLALWLGCLAGYGQVELNPPKAPSTITVDVDLVNILCSVRDKSGGYVKGLSKEDFEVREDGKKQQITHFAHEVDSPLTVALLLDMSGSVADILGTEKEAAGKFFSAVIRPDDRALLVGFASLIQVWQDLTASKENLQMALDKAEPHPDPASSDHEVRPRGGTLLYDAVDLVASEKLKKMPGRKVMVLITDGEDNGSIVKLAEAVEAAQAADTAIYAIHYAGHFIGGLMRSGMQALRKMAEPTGGRVFEVSKDLPLEAIFTAIEEEMRNQYGLGYAPPGAGDFGAFHRLEVKSLKPDLKVQARNGYYGLGK